MNKEQLLEKYYAGETTREEEELLRKENWLEEEFSIEKDLFADIQKLSNQQVEVPMAKKKGKVRRLVLSIAMGAVAACMGILVIMNQPQSSGTEYSELHHEILVNPGFSGEITDEEEALAQAQKAFAFINKTVDESTEEVKHLQTINNTINLIKKQ